MVTRITRIHTFVSIHVFLLFRDLQMFTYSCYSVIFAFATVMDIFDNGITKRTLKDVVHIIEARG